MVSRVFLMRHALSVYNEALKMNASSMVDLDLKLIDCPLSLNGGESLKKLASNWTEELKNLEIDGPSKINFLFK
jgi:hypothetical protein